MDVMKNKSPFIAALCALGLFAAPVAAETIHTLETRPGVEIPIAVLKAQKALRGAVILLPGGAGKLKLDGGTAFLNKTGNFVIRARRRFAHSGFLTISMDAPAGSQALHGFRVSADHAKDIGATIAWARKKTGKPVWLIGFSRGTISAAGGAAQLGVPPAGPDGIVLMSAVTETSRDGKDTVYDVALERIKVPVIVVHHRDDECYVTPLYDALSLAKKLDATMIRIDGGKQPISKPCDSKSQHGFFGVERQTVQTLVKRMRELLPN